jgi:hypothetical protein
MKPLQPPQMPSGPKRNMEAIKARILSDKEYLHHPFVTVERQRSYVFEVTKGSKYLSYFGSDHTTEIGDPLFPKIQKAFEDARPQLVLVEGMESINDSKEEVDEIARNISLRESMEFGESSYVLKLAIDSGVEFESPEPNFSLEIQMLLDKGYTKKDIFTFYAYRDIYQYQRDHKDRHMEALREFLAPILQKLRVSSKASQEEITSFTNELFSDIDLNSDKYAKESDPIPWPEHPQVVTNDISRASNDFRDRHIVERIAEALKNYDRVFVIYGATHAVKQEPAIRALLA